MFAKERKTRQILILSFLLFIKIAVAQVSILNTQVQEFNITPNSLLNVSIMNGGATQQVILESKLYNASSELLLHVRSAPFFVQNGLNSPVNYSPKIASAEYGNSKQANYIKDNQQLPGGRFKLCVSIAVLDNKTTDELCDEIEANTDQFLYLVNPLDKDTIRTKNPLLTWTHNELFEESTKGEYYRMTVVELTKKQDAEEGLKSNEPIFQKDFLTSHDIPYPSSSKKLEPGKRYGWQVQKIANRAVIAETEAWEFVMAALTSLNGPALLKKNPDGGFYNVINDQLTFRYYEEYSDANGFLSYKVFQKPSLPVPGLASLPVVAGNNEYALNVSSLSPGYYTLEVISTKNEKWYLKFKK